MASIQVTMASHRLQISPAFGVNILTIKHFSAHLSNQDKHLIKKKTCTIYFILQSFYPVDVLAIITFGSVIFHFQPVPLRRCKVTSLMSAAALFRGEAKKPQTNGIKLRGGSSSAPPRAATAAPLKPNANNGATDGPRKRSNPPGWTRF